MRLQCAHHSLQSFQIVNNDWDLIDLKVFCEVARRSSFVAAATELGISPAYVSKRVADLERALGVTLFHRTTRRVRISDSGEAAYAWARRVLEAVDGLNDSVSRTDRRLSGQLRISSSLRLGRNHLSPILAELHREHPDLEIWLELMDRRVDLLAEGFDIDIRMGEVSEPHLVTHLVVENARVLCAAPEYLARRGTPKTAAELAGHDCLLYRERHQTFGVWRLQGPQGIEAVKVTGRIGSNHSDIVSNWALAGHGIILLAGWDVAPALKSGKLQRILPEYRQEANVWAVTAAKLQSSPKLRTCTNFIMKRLRQGPHALDTSIR
ncbi:LysR substrate-binding domain-containing protein [Burkholderia sp. Ac-20353]|uniref:LysR substrate-binding domain-containing protein n=1 Tax=Burkholderia sp. Ac-20353 TaxID=2703894 RepID=UPI00197B3CAC|nr:LysR substrate-binding domain-containing protein [Burkholderia sp. Ac-20353]MBN3786648.1 LysR family transcriptional regulator [Burkholderia sp. Ac-20353]